MRMFCNMVIGEGPAGTAGLSGPDEGAALPSTGFAAPGPSLEVKEGPPVLLPVLPMPPMMNSIGGLYSKRGPVVSFKVLAVTSCSAAMSCMRA